MSIVRLTYDEIIPNLNRILKPLKLVNNGSDTVNIN